MTLPTPDLKTRVVDMQPVGRRIEISAGTTLLEAAQAAGVGLVSLCGGEGWCESCLVRIAKGEVNPPTQPEMDYLGDKELADGFRLACQVTPCTDVRIDIPPESLSTPQRLQVEGKDFDIPLAPSVEVIDLEISPPTLEDLRADADRVKDTLAENGFPDAHFELPVLTTISDVLRENKWSARFVVRESEIIAILPSGSGIYGISVDIGTTKLALYLVDLLTGEVVEKVGEMNPQIAYGEDVVSRIAYTTQNQDGLRTLQTALVNALNKLIQDVCKSTEINHWQIVDAVIVGNTAMHHLFAGLPVEQLAFAPYVPAVSEPLDFRATAIGIKLAPGSYIHLLPNIAGYVGADHSAVILSTELWKTDKTVLAIDIGTNTEISLVSKGQLMSCSCASGPAFEGAHITNGMRAAPGAIERVQIIDGKIKTFTIDDEPPIGICGSGILDVVAEMKSANLMDERGALIEGRLNIRKSNKNHLEFLLVPGESSGNERDITVSRKDVNEIQLAKAAIKAGQEILMTTAGITPEDIDEIIIAGAFGTYIDVPNAISVGMFPNIPVQRFRQIGNAAGMGAVQALISVNHRQLIKDVIKNVDYIELTTVENFQKEFVKAMYLR
ncbi:MAG: ASKHA domain-containing protein [Anaerolineales bacterium]|nr:ASKHA domain-containing protein [Anaerolineales bacterium]